MGMIFTEEEWIALERHAMLYRFSGHGEDELVFVIYKQTPEGKVAVGLSKPLPNDSEIDLLSSPENSYFKLGDFCVNFEIA